MSQHDSALLCAEDEATPQEEKSNPVYYLTRVSYNEQKHEIITEFSSDSNNLVKRERFHPFFYFNSGIGREKLLEFFISLGFRGFSVEEEGRFLCVRALSMELLKKMSNALALHAKKKPLVIEPERAFLLSKGWSFFDSFEEIDGLLFRSDLFSVPANSTAKVSVPDFGSHIIRELPFSEALRLSEEDALFMVSQSAWSNLLVVPQVMVPSSIEGKLEFFIENIFFKHAQELSFEESKKMFSSKEFEPISAQGLSKLDFSRVWTELFSNNFFNLGPETRNCDCCKPVVLEAKNLLPSSMIRVCFSQSNLFFESCSESFSFDFHNENDSKDLRLEKKREFFLNSFPVGPFSAGEVALVPLLDALRLIEQGKAKLVSSAISGKQLLLNGNTAVPLLSKPIFSDSMELHDLHWFCLHRESFFSKEIRFSNSILFNLRKRIDSHDSVLFAQKPFSYFYFGALYAALSALLANLPRQLTNPNSQFFSTDLAKNIVSVQEATIAKFREFSEKEGYRVLHADKSKALVKGFSTLKLARAFSRNSALPEPQIVGFRR